LKLAGLILIGTLMMLPAMAVAQLGSSNHIVTEVAFQFMIGNRAVPAGTYKVSIAALKMSSALRGSPQAIAPIVQVCAQPILTLDSPGKVLVCPARVIVALCLPKPEFR